MRFFGIITAVCCITAALFAKPVAVVRCVPYSQYDADHLTMRVLQKLNKSYEVFAEPLPVDKFADYSAVFILVGAPELNENELGTLKNYIKNGGVVVLTAQAPISFGGKVLRQGKFPGIKKAFPNRKKEKNVRVVKKNHPFTAGISGTPQWLAGSQFLALPADGAEIIASDNAGQTALMQYKYGKGRIIYIGHAYLRTNRKDPADVESYTQIMFNLVKSLASAAPGAELKSKFPKENLLIWRRAWSKYPEARPLFEPNYPRTQELCSEISFFSAAGERDTQFFVVQSPTAQELEITPPENKSFTLLKMSQAAPMYALLRKGQPRKWAEAEGNYFLKAAEKTVKMESGQPEVFAVRFDTDKLAPGKYRDTIRIGEKNITINAEVYPVSLAGRRKFDLRTWGYSLPTDRPATLEMYRLHNLVQVDLPLIRWAGVKVKNSGETLAQAVKRDPEQFKKRETFPQLEFPAEHLEALRVYAAHGLYVGRVRGLPINRFLQEVNGGAIPVNEIDWNSGIKTAYTEFYRQLTEFYSSRGFYDLTLATFDEPEEDRIRQRVLPANKMRHEAGLKSGASWTFSTLKNKEILKQLGPISYWGVYTVIAHEIDELNSKGKLGNANDFGYFIGSTPETRRPSEYGRTYGRFAFSLSENFRFAIVGPAWKEWLYYGYNPVFGVWGQRLFAWDDPEKKTILNCAFVDGVRDGIDDTNLNWHLQYLLRKLAPFAKKDAALAAQLAKVTAHSKKRLADLAFRKHPASAKQSSGPYEYVKLGPDMTPVQAELFKKSILDDLMLLKPFAAKYLRPEINYKGVDLSNGAVISGNCDIPGVTHDPEANAAITCTIDSMIGKNDWRIAVNGSNITISAGDKAGLALGIKMFTHNLDISGKFFL